MQRNQIIVNSRLPLIGTDEMERQSWHGERHLVCSEKACLREVTFKLRPGW